MPTTYVENSTPKDASSKIVALSFLSWCTLIDIAPANSKNGNITWSSTKLKSKLSVIVYAISMKEGKKNPSINTTIDSIIAKIIRPIVIGSFNNLMFIIEKKEANIRRIVLSSRISNFLFSINEKVWVTSSTKNVLSFNKLSEIKYKFKHDYKRSTKNC